MAFADVIADAAVGEEAAAVVDDDRRLPDRADVVDRVASATSPVFAPMMISTSIILSTGEKKWMPMKFSALCEVSASEAIGSVEVLLAKITSGPSNGLRLLGRLLLDCAVLEHRLDDEVAALQIGVIGARVDAREQRVAVGALGAALGDLVGDQLLANAPCPCRRSPGRGRSARLRARPWRRHRRRRRP